MFAPRGWLQGRGNQATYRTILGSGEFSSPWYRLVNMTGSEKFTDPLWHYITRGWQRGCDPSPRFDSSFYLAWNGDVRGAGVNPFDHYLSYGRAEGRPALQPLSDWRPVTMKSLEPLRFYTAPQPAKGRLTLVLDAHTPNRWRGDVAFLILCGAWMAEGTHKTLRVLAREGSPDIPDLSLDTFVWPGGVAKPDITRVPAGREYSDIEKHADELFVATSWSSAHTLHQAQGGTHLSYLVIDDEPAHLPEGEAKHLARSARSLPGVTYVTTHAMAEGSTTPSAAIAPNGLSSFLQSGHSEDSPRVVVWGGVSPDASFVRLALQGVERAIYSGVIDPERTPIVVAGGMSESLLLVGTHQVSPLTSASLEEELGQIASSHVVIALTGHQGEHPVATFARAKATPVVGAHAGELTPETLAQAITEALSHAPSPSRSRSTLDSQEQKKVLEKFATQCGKSFS
jgi:hypothetical protein